MGVYDTVHIDCPVCILGDIEAQVKTGPCDMKRYDLYGAPANVLAGLANQIYICPKCGTALEVKLQVTAHVRRAQVDEKYDGIAED